MRSVERSLDILETLAAERELPLVEVARRVGLAPSSVHRLLATLVGRGYVDQDAQSGSYRIARRPIPTAAGAAACETPRPWLRPAVRPYLERARKVTGAAANLAVLERGNTVYLDQVRTRPAVSMFVGTGKRVPAHASAAGKVLMCERWRQNHEVLAGNPEFKQYTRTTLTTRDEIGRELRRIEERGYAIDDQEHQPGISCVAAPIFDDTSEAVAAVSIAGPSAMIEEIGVDELGEFVVTLTSELSAELRQAAVDEVAYRLAAAG